MCVSAIFSILDASMYFIKDIYNLQSLSWSQHTTSVYLQKLNASLGSMHNPHKGSKLQQQLGLAMCMKVGLTSRPCSIQSDQAGSVLVDLWNTKACNPVSSQTVQ